MINKIKIFESWKKEFFQIKELNYFNVYLVGTFNDYLNGKFSDFDENKKYTINEINNMSNQEIINLNKFLFLDDTDIDIVITGNNDFDKIKKVIEKSQKINNKYVDKNNYIFFDLIYYSIDLWETDGFSHWSEEDGIECEKIYFEYGLKRETTKLPYSKHKEMFSMGYIPSKPTLLRNKVL